MLWIAYLKNKCREKFSSSYETFLRLSDENLCPTKYFKFCVWPLKLSYTTQTGTFLYNSNRVERQLSTIIVNNSIHFVIHIVFMFSDSSEKMSWLTFHDFYLTLLCLSRRYTINTLKFILFLRKVKKLMKLQTFKIISRQAYHIVGRCIWNIFHMILLHLLCGFLP